MGQTAKTYQSLLTVVHHGSCYHDSFCADLLRLAMAQKPLVEYIADSKLAVTFADSAGAFILHSSDFLLDPLRKSVSW